MESLSSSGSLYEALGTLADTRDGRGKRYPAQFILVLTVAAMLSGRKNLLGVAEWARDQPRSFLRALGLPCYHTPSKSLFYLFFKQLNIEAFEELLGRWLRGISSSELTLQATAIDGKTLRGSARKGAQVPGVHLISAYLNSSNCVLAQLRVDEKTNEHKAALELIKKLILETSLITGDAMFCQRDLSQEVIDGDGDYFWVVKDNQSQLKATISDAFSAPVSPSGEETLAS